MMGWRVHECGPVSVMKFGELPRPAPGSGEVLVRVEAAGVGPWDAWIRAGKSALPQPLPLTLGSDLSGEIVGVGQGVSDLRAGDKVYGVTNPRFIGAYAEFAGSSAAMISMKPRSLSFIQAASVPITAVTPYPFTNSGSTP
jgi:NADPH:quinone reductase-like Zn-dependent oxidoreductase